MSFKKRSFDIAVSLVCILVLSPVYVFIALAILVDSGRPILFKQKRVGMCGRPFHIYKFRTMVVGADKIGPYFTSDDDDRITRVGRFLRKTSLDELPQLINVLKGDMSLVGPRPDVFEQKAMYREQDWEVRNSVRPGITGLAQVSGRSSLSFEDRLRYDIEYVKESGLFLDIKIILRTAWSVISRKGSN